MTKKFLKADAYYQSDLFSALMGGARDTSSKVVEPTAHYPSKAHTPLKDEVKADVDVAEQSVSPLSFERDLPAASLAYDISPNPSDYFFRPVIVMITDLPNRNGVGFAASELMAWNANAGCRSYMTWRGKPVYEEHGAYHPDPKNPDPKLAIGMIADAAITPLIGFAGNKLWKVVLLLAIDRTKKPALAALIETGKQNTYSMGAMVDSYYCSYCGADEGDCNHIDPDEDVQFYEYKNSLVYRLVRGITACECSAVADPAYATACSDIVHIKY